MEGIDFGWIMNGMVDDRPYGEREEVSHARTAHQGAKLPGNVLQDGGPLPPPLLAEEPGTIVPGRIGSPEHPAPVRRSGSQGPERPA
jgi:hypothetical protein